MNVTLSFILWIKHLLPSLVQIAKLYPKKKIRNTLNLKLEKKIRNAMNLNLYRRSEEYNMY